MNNSVINLFNLKKFLHSSYARNLVLKTDLLEVILVCWLPGQGSPIHDHGESDAVTIVLEGEMNCKTYYSEVNEEANSTVLKPGDFEHIPSGVKHEVKNNSNTNLVTLHIYSPPLSPEQQSLSTGYANYSQISEISGVCDSYYLMAQNLKKPKTIAIIGGGFSGTLVATQIIKNHNPESEPLQLIMVERASKFARGFAYSTSSGQHLLNVPAANMSAFPDDPDHFVRWLESNNRGFSRDSFVPRMLYGEYLESILFEAEKNKPANINFIRLNDEALSIQKQNEDSAIIHLASGIQFPVSKVVLAVGNYPPRNIKTKDNLTKKIRTYTNPRFYSRDPWSGNALRHINTEAPILLIGTGLTMVDKAIELKNKGVKKIYAVSRHGLMPKEHASYKKLSDLNLSLGFENQEQISLRDALRKIRILIKEANQAGSDWRLVIDSLRTQIQSLWLKFSHKDKKRFFKFLRPYWDIHRHRMPPESASTINEMIKSGQLEVLRGRIKDYQENKEDVTVTVDSRGEDKFISAGKIINCTGSELDFCQIEDPLIMDLLHKGLIKPDSMSLGLEATSEGTLMESDGKTSEILYTLGPPLKGQLWETTAVPEIRCQASALAKLLLSKVKSLV